MEIPVAAHKNLVNILAAMRDERYPWYNYWQDLARYILPRRYVFLDPGRTSTSTAVSSGVVRTNRRATTFHNPTILDSTGTLAARTLANGMLNGITSPARKWFRLTVRGLEDFAPAREWLDTVQEQMFEVMASTNFYNAMALIYTDLAVFGSAAMIIYEDFEDVFRCYNFALGEFYFQQDNRQVVRRMAREFYWRVDQIVKEFGIDNVPDGVRLAFERGGDSLSQEHLIVHMIEPNDAFSDDIGLPTEFDYREVYWIYGRNDGQVLRVRGFADWPAVLPRWDIVGNDSYGTSPSADALADIKQLQHMTRRKAQGMDKLISPPIVADIQLQHRPAALMPNGITYVAGTNNVGVKPLFTVNPPLGEINQDILRLQQRIREVFHNDLFRMISQLDTVRTATEVDARREEKLVLLGPVLERFQNEALDPAISRVFTIMDRRQLFPPPPEELQGRRLEVDYVSILSDAQRAVGAVPLERFAAFVGNLAGLVPDAVEIPDWQDLIRDYAEKIGVEQKNVVSREDAEAARSARQALQEIQAAGQAVQPIAEAAQTASQTDTAALKDLLGA